MLRRSYTENAVLKSLFLHKNSMIPVLPAAASAAQRSNGAEGS
jgi:hypothetical protein